MNSKKTILYIGQLNKGGTCRSRQESLKIIGNDVISFDTSIYTGCENRFERTIAHRLNIGRPVDQLNRDIITFARKCVSSVDYIWIDKGKWVFPDTIDELKKIKNPQVVIHYTPDPQLVFNKSSYFNASIPLYDILFTTKPFELDLYKEINSNTFLIHQSYDQSKLYPIDAAKIGNSFFTSDVCFIGRCEKHYIECLARAISTGANVKVWGPRWKRHMTFRPSLRKNYEGSGVWDQDYSLAINSASIGLCLLSKRYNETTTTRTFEIPACKTFMLAERTEQHLELFKEGKEAEYFSDENELVDKIQYYLKNPRERQKIAKAGYKRSLKSGYSNLDRMKQILTRVTNIE